MKRIKKNGQGELFENILKDFDMTEEENSHEHLKKVIYSQFRERMSLLRYFEYHGIAIPKNMERLEECEDGLEAYRIMTRGFKVPQDVIDAIHKTKCKQVSQENDKPYRDILTYCDESSTEYIRIPDHFKVIFNNYHFYNGYTEVFIDEEKNIGFFISQWSIIISLSFRETLPYAILNTTDIDDTPQQETALYDFKNAKVGDILFYSTKKEGFNTAFIGKPIGVCIKEAKDDNENCPSYMSIIGITFKTDALNPIIPSQYVGDLDNYNKLLKSEGYEEAVSELLNTFTYGFISDKIDSVFKPLFKNMPTQYWHIASKNEMDEIDKNKMIITKSIMNCPQRKLYQSSVNILENLSLNLSIEDYLITEIKDNNLTIWNNRNLYRLDTNDDMTSFIPIIKIRK